MRRYVPGIFCLEGGWSSDLRSRHSVLPLLEYLQAVGQVRFVHERAYTFAETIHLLRKWPQRQYERFSLGYFGFHGTAGKLHLGRRTLTLEELGDVLAGACSGRTIYFGSCSVLDLPRRQIERFRRKTDARCVAGYTRDIDWFESAAFDLLLFEALTRYQRIDAVDRWLRAQYGGLIRGIGFRMSYG